MSTGRSTAHTCVFWDVQDFPVPKGRDPDSVYENIKLALANKGFAGIVHIRAYGRKNKVWDDFLLDGITVIPEGDKDARVKRMIRDVLFWALDNRVHPSAQRIVMVISEHIGQDLDFLSVLQGLHSREYKILLADVASVKQPEFVSEEWLWRSLFDGGDPIERSQSVKHDDDNLKRKDTAKDTDKRSSIDKRKDPIERSVKHDDDNLKRKDTAKDTDKRSSIDKRRRFSK
ncbi:PREDICTED: uncharacterized protein LOC104712455 [Camelina sativa]|uniref:Uncharacterized protein LOC104712455 n=1 Tax=Camelina sativa TaxID=90675 RepID=A0ABM0TKB2_CAMSA|nr:PREDICTED: uncharacterized protein LOC104712455 [Camelina sativa]